MKLKLRGTTQNSIFRFGEIYDYSEEGIEATGDYDNGECGIIIRDINYAKSGDWKCEITRKGRPGSARLGSEATSSSFRVDVFRTSRLNDDNELLLQVILSILRFFSNLVLNCLDFVLKCLDCEINKIFS